MKTNNAKTVALIITFTGLAVALNPAISGITFPFPLLPTLYFQIWEIPLITAFMLFGSKVALSADFLNAIFLIAFFPGLSQPYYWISAFATAGMMAGIYLAFKLQQPPVPKGKPLTKTKFLSLALGLSMLFRVVIMAALMFSVLYFDPLNVYPPMPALWISVTILPPQAIFNIIMPIIIVPSSYLVAKTINRNLTINSKLF